MRKNVAVRVVECCGADVRILEILTGTQFDGKKTKNMSLAKPAKAAKGKRIKTTHAEIPKKNREKIFLTERTEATEGEKTKSLSLAKPAKAAEEINEADRIKKICRTEATEGKSENDETSRRMI